MTSDRSKVSRSRDLKIAPKTSSKRRLFPYLDYYMSIARLLAEMGPPPVNSTPAKSSRKSPNDTCHFSPSSARGGSFECYVILIISFYSIEHRYLYG